MDILSLIAPIAAIIGLIVAFSLAAWISKADEGNDRMKEIAGHIRAVSYTHLRKQCREIEKTKNTAEKIIGNSEAMRELRQMIYHVAESDSTVLLRGETGCGKELVANALHNMSRRAILSLIHISSSRARQIRGILYRTCLWNG